MLLLLASDARVATLLKLSQRRQVQLNLDEIAKDGVVVVNAAE